MTNVIEKGWGREVIFASNPEYCGKLLIFDKIGNKSSMHFHLNKHETWYVNKGSFKVNWINHINASMENDILKEGDVWVNEQGCPHQLEALEDNSIIFEVSSEDHPNDNFRVSPGDSQK